MRKVICIGLILVFSNLVLIVYQKFRFENKLIVVFCDVGQGDGAFMRTPEGNDIVIDTGPDSSMLGCISSNLPFWDREIDLIVISHFNLDHVAGLIDILRRYEVKRIALPTINTERNDVKKYMSLFKEKNIAIDDLGQNDVYKIENLLTLTTLGPQHDSGLIEENDSSLIQILSYNNYDFLFTGDASFGILNPILRDLGEGVEVFKVPHHGSKTGLNGESFMYFKPNIAVISSGKSNRYGHPHKSIIEILEQNKIQIRQTAKEGNIRFVIRQ